MIQQNERVPFKRLTNKVVRFPDFNVCTNTILYSLSLYSTTYPLKEWYNVFDVNYFYTKNRNRYKPHRIVKDSHLKERSSIALCYY